MLSAHPGLMLRTTPWEFGAGRLADSRHWWVPEELCRVANQPCRATPESEDQAVR